MIKLCGRFRICFGLWFLIGSLSAAASHAGSNAVELRQTWNWTATSPSSTSRAMAVGRTLDDQRRELLFVGSPYSDSMLVEGGYWFTLAQRGEGFEQLWSSLGMEPAPLGLIYVDGPEPSIVLWTAAAVEVFDSATKRHLRTIALDSPPYVDSTRDLAVADIDGLGGLELLTINQHDLFVRDFESGALLTTRFGFGGSRLALGQADEDPALEIALSGNALGGYLLDGSTWSVQWGQLDGFGWGAWLVDIDGDSLCEVVTNEPNSLEAWNPRSGDRLWARAGLQLLDLEIGSLSSSGLSIVGRSSLTSSLEVYRATDGTYLWSVGLDAGIQVGISLGNVDDDAATEIILASRGWQPVLTVDSETHLMEASAERFRGPYPALSAGDFDLDGQFDLLANGILDGEFQGGWVQLEFDVASKSLVSVDLPASSVGGNPVGSSVLQADSDPQPEICVSVAGDHGLVCLDGASREVEFEVPFPHDSQPLAQIAGDVAGDSRLELIVVTWEGFVHAYGGNPISEIWVSSQYRVHRDAPVIRVGEIDGVSGAEIILGGIGSSTGYVTVLDGETGGLKVGPFAVWVSALEIVDRGPLLSKLVLVGTPTGRLSELDLSSGEMLPPIATFEDEIRSLRSVDLTRDGVSDLAIAVAGTIVVRGGAEAATIWESGLIMASAAEDDSMFVSDIEGNGIPDLLVNTGIGFVVFEGPLHPVFADGFEAGDTVAWSDVLP